MDLRWKVTGAHSLAAAINRAAGPGAAECTAVCLARADMDENGSRNSDAPLPQLAGRHWVLTWPKDMVSLDVERLVLLKREEALHRSRNYRPLSAGNSQGAGTSATAAAH